MLLLILVILVILLFAGGFHPRGTDFRGILWILALILVVYLLFQLV